MKFLATILISGLLTVAAVSQTTKPRAAVPKANPAAIKAKSQDVKNKTVASKIKTAPSKAKPNVVSKTPAGSKVKATTSKPGAKAKPTAIKIGTKANPSSFRNNPAAPNPPSKSSQNSAAAKAKPPLVKPNPSAEKLDDAADAEFDKAMAVADVTERIAALKKFIKNFASSKRAVDASVLIATIHSQSGAERLAAGDIAGAVENYRAAIKVSPKPVPDVLFSETLVKIPSNLYFRGARSEGFEIARALEEKISTSVGQLLSVAAFYMSVEDGSEAKRVAGNALKIDPASAAAYETLGLASRIDFLLEESAAAYAKALELAPDSWAARRGLAEMKRSLGKSDDAVTLYREILIRDEADLAARTGLVLALFDAGKRTDAEAELGRSLAANPGNVILLAGAAYWYAVYGEGDRAVDLAQKAVAADPRFIWSHIALARGYISQKNPTAAEQTLLAARRYGNFPTLEYEIASARAAAGFYREASEELAKSFSIKDGIVYTNLGGRVKRGSKDFAELVGFERRASIFAPTAADNPENSAWMTALLELKQELDQSTPKAEIAMKAADAFVRGDDKMRIHRLIFAGTQLLDKKVALPKVVDLMKTAPASLDAGLDAPDPTAAVMASELFEGRSIAAARGEYISVPVVARPTLSSILRGRVEEINGWALYQMDDPAQASVHLKRAVSVLPGDSAWWRSSTWRLGTALVLEGKNLEAIEIYIRSYKSGPPDALRYNAIETLFRRVNGHTMGLENRIGPNPATSATGETVSREPKRSSAAVPSSLGRVEPTPRSVPVESPKTSVEEAKPESLLAATPEEIRLTPTPDPTPTPVDVKASVIAESVLSPIPQPSPTATPEDVKSAIVPDPAPQLAPDIVITNVKTPDTREAVATSKLIDDTKGLFPPVVITIPPPTARNQSVKTDPQITAVEERPSPSPDSIIGETKNVEKTVPEKTVEPGASREGRPRIIEGVAAEPVDPKPCKLTFSEETITLENGGGDLAVIVGRTDDGEMEGLTAASTSPDDVSIRREVIAGVKSRALFVVRSTSAKPGLFQINFEMPCGKKEIAVRVR